MTDVFKFEQCDKNAEGSDDTETFCILIRFDHAGKWISKIQSQVEEALPRLTSAVEKEDFHATLIYAQGIPASEMDELRKEARGFIGAEDRFNLTLGPVQTMTSNNDGHVVYVAVTSKKLEQLHRKMRTIAERHGGSFTYPDFVGHITLGYQEEPFSEEEIEALGKIGGFKAVMVGDIEIEKKSGDDWEVLDTFRLFIDIDDAVQCQEHPEEEEPGEMPEEDEPEESMEPIMLEPIALEDVIEAFRDSFDVKLGAVNLTGGFLDEESPHDDVIVLLNIPTQDELICAISQRLESKLPMEICNRVLVLPSSMTPISNHIPLYDITLTNPTAFPELREMTEIVEGIWELLHSYGSEIGDTVREFLQKPYTWHQGKARIISQLRSKIPSHKTYVEPFCGGATLFWAKHPSDKEVLGDTDPEAINLLSFLQGMTNAEIDKLRGMEWVCHSDSQFNKIKESSPRSNADRFHRHVFLRMWSFQGRGSAFFPKTSRPRKPPTFLNHLEKYRDRLRGVKLVHQDGVKTIKQYDGPDTFFYIDPPYSHRRNDVMSYDARPMVDALRKIKGKALVSHDAKDLLAGGNWKRHTINVKSARADHDTFRTEYMFRNYSLRG